jgi:tetratricopeptide (TPR) repeat protein
MNLRRTKLILTTAAISLLIALGWWFVWPRVLLRQAEEAIVAKDLDKAEAVLSRLIRHSPKNARARFLFAQVLRRLHRPDDAEESLRKALQLGYPENDGKRELALAEAIKQFRPPIAITLRRISQENPDDLEVLEALARGYVAIQDWPQADFYFTALIERQPERAEMYQERGQARLAAARQAGEGHNRAAADFREVLRRLPDHFEAHLGLAQCLLSDAKMAEAKEEFRLCHELDAQRSEPLIGLANCALETHDWNLAEARLNEALQREPASVIALGMRGDLCLHRQKYTEAIPYFQRVLFLDPANKAAHLKLAQAFRQIGKIDDAKDQEALFERLRLAEEKGTSFRP